MVWLRLRSKRPLFNVSNIHLKDNVYIDVCIEYLGYQLTHRYFPI